MEWLRVQPQEPGFLGSVPGPATPSFVLSGKLLSVPWFPHLSIRVVVTSSRGSGEDCVPPEYSVNVNYSYYNGYRRWQGDERIPHYCHLPQHLLFLDSLGRPFPKK